MFQDRFQHWMNFDLKLQFKSLFHIIYSGNATSTRLSSALGVTPADITGVIGRLIPHDLVQRKKNPEDRRVIFLQATD